MRRGHKVDGNNEKMVNPSDSDIILAAKNDDGEQARKFSSRWRGTNGVAVWGIEGSNYVIALAWRVPKYRKLLRQANTISVSAKLHLDRRM